MKETEKLQDWIDKSQRVVFFGGAGVSTESGIPDFRSVDGLYNQTYEYPPETILSHSFYLNHTEKFYRFYRDKILYLDARPNQAHIKLAEMDQAGKVQAVVTQNIDGLHQAAGSHRVWELHGSIHRNYCTDCGKFYTARYIREQESVPHCNCGGVIKPDVVLYEEGLDQKVLTGAISAVASADLLIIGGTSLAVYPAAGLIDYFQGKAVILINRTVTPKDAMADLIIRESIGKVFGQIQVREKK